MKKLQKGFSLVELLVVVAIIGVLAGVGIVGYTGYTQSAKERVAIANFNSVKRFVATEMTLLNNNVQTSSASVRAFTGGPGDCVATAAQTQLAGAFNNDGTVNLDLFLRGVVCYFDVAVGYGSQFANPFNPTRSQVVYDGGAVLPGNGVEEGTINIGLLVEDAGGRSGVGAITSVMEDNSDGATAGGQFIIEYNQMAVVGGVEVLQTGTTGDVVGQLYELE